MLSILKRRFMVSAVVSGFSLAGAWGDGYRNPPPTAAGIAKANVHSAFVGDASAVSYNPANLGLLEKSSVVMAGTLARSENSYTPAGSAESYASDADWQVLPNLYYAAPVSSGMTLGLGVTTPYGQSVSYAASDFLNLVTGPDPVPYEARVLMIHVNPTLAVKLMDRLYLGLGADVAYSEFELKAIGLAGPPPAPSYTVSAEGEGWGIGGNVGLTWLPTQRQRVALTYRSRIDMDYKGDYVSPVPNDGSFASTMKYPNLLSGGYGIQMTDTLRVEAMVEWIEWSVNDVQTLDLGGTSVSIDHHWDDTFTYGVSGSWRMADALILRAGYSYIESPIPDDTLSPLLVDSDRQVIGVGLGYSIGGHALDLAYAYSFFEDRATPSARYEMSSDLFGATYSLRF